MIRHIVMWTLKDPGQAGRFKALLDSCASLVPGMLQFEVGIRAPALAEQGLEATVDVVLNSLFASAADLAAYQHHAVHKAVGAQLGPMRAERHVLDFVVTDAGPCADLAGVPVPVPVSGALSS